MKDNGDNDLIMTPNYPHLYPANVDICWQAYLVTPDPSKRIVFEFNKFNNFFRH